MKVLALNGSPRKRGNTASLMQKILDGAKSNGHEVEMVHVYDLELKGCIACKACKDEKVNFCVIKDGLQDIYPKIVEADVIILGSPIYIGHVTGPMKTLIDRFYTFGRKDYTVRFLPGKKFITVVTSGAPNETYRSVEEFLQSWLSRFFKMEKSSSMLVGSMINPDDAQNNEELMEEALRIGKTL